MRPSKQAEALYLAYENDENVEFVETHKGNQFNGVTLSTKKDFEGPSSRLIGEDAANIKVQFEIIYDPEGGVATIRILRGRNEVECGEVAELVVG